MNEIRLRLLAAAFLSGIAVAAQAADETVLASVGGQTITSEDLRAFETLADRALSPELAATQRDSALLRALIDKTVLLEEARRRGIGEEMWFGRQLQARLDAHVVNLYTTALINEQVSVSQEEMEEHFAATHRDRALRYAGILVETEEEAREVIELVKEGADFADFGARAQPVREDPRAGGRHRHLPAQGRNRPADPADLPARGRGPVRAGVGSLPGPQAFRPLQDPRRAPRRPGDRVRRGEAGGLRPQAGAEGEGPSRLVARSLHSPDHRGERGLRCEGFRRKGPYRGVEKGAPVRLGRRRDYRRGVPDHGRRQGGGNLEPRRPCPGREDVERRHHPRGPLSRSGEDPRPARRPGHAGVAGEREAGSAGQRPEEAGGGRPRSRDHLP